MSGEPGTGEGDGDGLIKPAPDSIQPNLGNNEFDSPKSFLGIRGKSEDKTDYAGRVAQFMPEAKPVTHAVTRITAQDMEEARKQPDKPRAGVTGVQRFASDSGWAVGGVPTINDKLDEQGNPIDKDAPKDVTR